MTNKSIKIVFQTYNSNGALKWDEYEEKVINSVTSTENPSFNVFIKYPMPISEMNSAIRELCDRIRYKLNCRVSYTSEDQCIQKDTNDIITSVTYYIQISSVE